MPFKFRLEKILQLRREALDQARLRVIEADKQLKLAIEKVKKITEEIRFANEEMIRRNYDLAQDRLRQIRSLQDKLKKAKLEQSQREQELAQAKYEVIEAHKRLEALEKLKEKQRVEFYEEENRIEQIQTDEKASLKYAREMILKANASETSDHTDDLEEDLTRI